MVSISFVRKFSKCWSHKDFFVLPSKSFPVLLVIFGCIIHLQLNFVMVPCKSSILFYFFMDIQLIQYYLLNRPILQCQLINQVFIYTGIYFWVFYSISLFKFYTFAKIPHYHNNRSFIVIISNDKIRLPILFIQIDLAVLGLSCLDKF